MLVTASSDQTAHVWEAATGREVVRINQSAPVMAAAFGPDGELLATVSSDNSGRIWEASTGREVARVSHPVQATAPRTWRSLAFSPDGRWLATAGLDNTARVWEASAGHPLPDDPEDLISEACLRIDRNLTAEEWLSYIGDEPYSPTCPD